MRILLINLLLLWTLVSSSQSLNIELCQQKAKMNYPLIKQYELLELSKEYSISNATKQYLPQISLNGQISYQTDVTSVPLNVPGVNLPAISKDQYKTTLDVNQIIWDGGSINSQKRVINSKNNVDKQNIEVNLYAIKEQIKHLYFGILILNEQIMQQSLLNDNLQNSYNMAASGVKNGINLPSDLDLISIEILSNLQKQAELKSLRKGYIDMLSLLINEPINENQNFEKPINIDKHISITINRPEQNLFVNKHQYLDAQEDAINAKNKPKISLFAQGGYGRPGLNMMTNKFDFWGIGGIRLSWNFGNLYTRKNEKKIISTEKNALAIQEETFLLNTKIQQAQANSEITKTQKMLEQDDEIIALREKIKKTSEGKYKNGVYSINDMIKDINAESISRTTKVIHEIQYLQHIYNHKIISGN